MADIEKVIRSVGTCFDSWIDAHSYMDSSELDKVRQIKNDALELLKEQQKTGHWDVLTMCANEGTYCSVCHTKIFDFMHPPKKKLSQYCPHCGAKMEDGNNFA